MLPLEKPIAFYPILAKLFGSVNAALYFQQLYYWGDKGSREDGFIYKTKNKIEEETSLSRYQQDIVRRKLVSLNVLETKVIKANGNPILHYKIKARIVRTLLNESQETYYSITENTTENTNNIKKQKVNQKQKKTKLPTFDERCAERLRKIIKKRRGLNKTMSISDWSSSFRKLRVEEEVDKKRITTALKWYSNKCGDAYVPGAYTGRSFRTKFLMIEDAIKRDKRDHPQSKRIKPADLSKEGKKILSKLKILNWPKGSAVDLPEVITLSLENYKAYLKRHKKAYEKAKGDRSTQRLIKFLSNKLESPSSFVYLHLLRTHEQIHTWTNWYGNLVKHIFDANSGSFQRRGRAWTADYCNDPTRWDKYIKIIGQVSK